MFIQNQQSYLLSNGYKIFCIELPCNETIEEQEKKLDINMSNILASDEEGKLLLIESKKRLSFKDKFNIIFIDPYFEHELLDDSRVLKYRNSIASPPGSKVIQGITVVPNQ